MSVPSLKTSLLAIGILMIPVFGYFLWDLTVAPETLADRTEGYAAAGRGAKEDLELHPALAFSEKDGVYTVEDTATDGIQIKFANAEAKPEEKSRLNLAFPKDYAEPIEVKLDDKRSIQITDLSGKNGYTSEPLLAESFTKENQGFLASLFKSKANNAPKQYLRYASDDGRKSLLYAFQKDQATGEKKLKHWTLYQKGPGLETEEYEIKNAKVRIADGKAEVYYFGEQDLKNEAATSEVDSNLLERAQRTLAKEMADDIFSGGYAPDLTIPVPYYLDREGVKHEAEWKWNEEAKTLSVSFTPENYPVALDPTLSFTAPGQSNTGSVITGDGVDSQLGSSFAAGDLNADGKIDLAVGAITAGSTYAGRVYIFYNDGSIASTAVGADVTISAPTGSDQFGASLATGDFNGDGRTDLIASGDYHNSVWIFYNDGSYPSVVASADVHISGDESTNFFGRKIVTGDFNFDGKTDFSVSDDYYSSQTGRVYIFYSDGTNNYGTASCTGSVPTECLASNADVKITGGAAGDQFGLSLAAGDFNADSRIDIAIGAYAYSSSTGRAYIFYNDGSIPTTAGTADVTITGTSANNRFGISLASGDLNADGRIDLAVGAQENGSSGKAYIFYNDGSIPTTAGTADVTISGKPSDVYGFGTALATGDLNADGRTDLVVHAAYYTIDVGEVYVFYNDGAYPSSASNADVSIAGQISYDRFGSALLVADLNIDGRPDLIVGAALYGGVGANIGRTYIFYSQNGQVNTNQSITGGATGNYFGVSMVTGDFNADGRTDLAVGANGYSSSTGRTYIFYGDGQIPSSTASADVTITGGAAGDNFGIALAAGDFNANGTVDLVVGANLYSTQSGRAYIFYNDGSIPTTAGTADVIITGESSSRFGQTLMAGDFNADGKTDLVASAPYYSGGNAAGRVYLYTADGTNNFGTATCSGTPALCTATDADAIITGENNSDRFGSSLATGDINADGKVDLIAGAYSYSSNTGRVYAFYNGSITTESASGADVTLTGESATTNFGQSVATGDFNADGRTDLVVGSDDYSTGSGRVYIFYNDGSYPSVAASADAIITGSSTYLFLGTNLQAGDFNADGRTDLAVGSHHYDAGAGKVFIFYNDGSYPSSSSEADVTLTGTAAADEFGVLTAGDMNGDGRVDLIVSSSQYSTNTGQVYIYETRENFSWQIQRQFSPTGNTRTGLNGAGQEIQITGEVGAVSNFAASMVTGDLNADGKPDLIVGAYGYSTTSGRLYIFYSDGNFPNGASSADNIISGEANYNGFGNALAVGDVNTDGKADLIVGASGYSTNTGRTYIFYNDGSYPIAAASADVTITGNSTSDYFGSSVITGDFNADGRTDVAVGANGYSTNTGRAYIFYNDGSIPTTAGTADVTITGNASNDSFASVLTAGDVNADGKSDLIISAPNYSTETGRAYIFYGDGSIPTTAATADVTITGETTNNDFGSRLAVGDLNSDGKTDLIVSAYRYSGYTGRAYIFYNDGSIPTTAGTADVTIAGSGYLGSALATGDFDADGRTDLAVGADYYSSTYLFYNDGSIPTTVGTADVTLSGGESSPDYYGGALAVADFNADGRTDLAVGAWYYQTGTGRTYIYTFNDPIILGATAGDNFGWSLVSADFNADGRTDLAVSATGYSTNTGRVYVFYNDGIIPSGVASADAIITGQTSGDYFGVDVAAGDFNGDGKIDLVASADHYSTDQGRIYIFYNGSITTENASGADYFITGNTNGMLGTKLAVGDMDASGTADILATQAYNGKVSIFYNDGTIPTTDGAADVIEVAVNVPSALAVGDFNFDGRVDWAEADTWTPGGTLAGSVNIFYNDGSYTTPDVTITGENANDVFGTSLATGDFNADGRTDLVVGAQGYTTSTGRAYIFYNDGSIPATAATADVIITGEGTSNNLGYAVASGDLNADGKKDLIVGARQYGSNNGRTYVFYNGSIVTENASGADVIMTGTTGNEFLGHAFAAGDFNADGKNDLAIGAYFYSSQTGRVYFLSSEAAATSTPPGVMTVKGTAKLKGNVRWK